MDKTSSNISHFTKKYLNVRSLLIAILVILCALEIETIFVDLHDIYRSSDEYTHRYGTSFQQNEQIAPSEIQQWMTFAYINFIFKLPANYLQDTLHLSDERYPNIQIIRYAHKNRLDVSRVLTNVQQAVAAYESR